MYSYNEKYLTKDQKPILPIMGEFHFSRYPKAEWETELYKMKAGGVQIVATYVFWIHHEEERGIWDFTKERCLGDFLNTCKKVGLLVWLRIGPWAHGECRNGGFPDWLVNLEKEGKIKLRTNDENYLSLVRELYGRIANQAVPYMYVNGGPIIGIQIENEYGHCGGPRDVNEGMAHMQKLREIAESLGMKAPYVSATGWGGAYVPEGMLAVLGGYVDAPWAEHTNELPASENFLFKPFCDDANIGSDLGSDNGGFTFDIHKVPYLTAELGGGLQVTGHRRTYPYPVDVEAQTICMLGAGANLIGYYMYHGGMNPDGKLSTLCESKATGYNNNLPEKSYDFETLIREWGEPNETYFRMKKHHMFIEAVQELLAPAVPYACEKSNDTDPENMTDIRAMFRYNSEADCGFLFINNHQRKRKMTDKKVTAENPLVFEVKDSSDKTKEIVFDNINVPSDACLILPYNIPLNNDRVKMTNASYLCSRNGKHYFYTDEEPFFVWENGSEKDNVVVLSTKEAEHMFESDGKVIVAEDASICLENGDVLSKDDMKVPVSFKALDSGEYELDVDYSALNDLADENGRAFVEDIILELDIGGDCARLCNQEGYLFTDWFSNGEIWKIALKRFGYPKKLFLSLSEFDERVYYDLPARKENTLVSAYAGRVIRKSIS